MNGRYVATTSYHPLLFQPYDIPNPIGPAVKLTNSMSATTIEDPIELVTPIINISD